MVLWNLIACDGIWNGITFLREKWQGSNRKKITEVCGQLYWLRTIERYILYSVLSVGVLVSDDRAWEGFSYLCTIPNVQNAIVQFWVTGWKGLRNKERIFTKYTIAKYIVGGIKDLDKGIVHVKNYHIFLLYRHINFKFGMECLKALSTICLFNYLRSNKETYFYYKAIKLSYYYNNEFLFHVLSKDEAIYIVNLIISEKRWKELCRIEVIQAIYTLAVDKYFDGVDWEYIKYFGLYNVLYFSVVWHILCLIKLFPIWSAPILLLAKSKRMFWFSVGVYTLALVGVNDLVVTIVWIMQDVFIRFFVDIVFFIQHHKDIMGVIRRI